MTNNKQSMKLYTEEQLERAIDLAKRNVSKNRIVESLTPIELPSDEEIEERYYKELADKILAEYEDSHEYHFHQVDREWLIKAMCECALIFNDTTFNTKEK